MVVSEDDGGRVQLKRPLHDDSRMHRRAVDRSVEQFLERQHAVPGIEKDGPEDLVAVAVERELKEIPRLLRIREPPAAPVTRAQYPERQLNDRPLLGVVQAFMLETLDAIRCLRIDALLVAYHGDLLDVWREEVTPRAGNGSPAWVVDEVNGPTSPKAGHRCVCCTVRTRRSGAGDPPARAPLKPQRPR